MDANKRLITFLVLSMATMVGMRYVMDKLGLLPPPPKQQAAQVQPAQPDNVPVIQEKGKEAVPVLMADQAKPGPNAAPAADEPKVERVAPEELVLGSALDKTKGGYHLEVQLEQRGGGIATVRSSRWAAERMAGQPKDAPLVLIGPDPAVPPSFALNLARPRAAGDPVPAEAGIPESVPITLEDRTWEVVRDPQTQRAVRAVTRTDPATNAQVQGQEVVLRIALTEPEAVTVTRTFRLWKGQDGLDMDLRIDSPKADHKLTYTLIGPHKVPIEGEWYTGTFRDVFFGGADGASTKILTISADTVAKQQDNPERYTRLPLRYAGVENQYFAVLIEPHPLPNAPADSHIAEAVPLVIHEDPLARQKADVSFALLSKPVEVGPNRPVEHAYRIFAGPKTSTALAAVGAEDVSAYRKGMHLWFVGDLGASFMAQRVIAPMLDRIYKITETIARAFGGVRGNYGIAIILLTMTVRLILFPLGRKAARAAKKMQDLQPLMAELKTKHGEDKEALTRETFALYKKHGVNPMGGCLPALVQLPVLIGLWQALNNSVALRHSSFLWIKDLAAPDMLFKFPFPIPLVGGWLGPYFNILPLVVVALMLVQTKLFSPPPATPEAEQQQKMMKYMMIFMMFMFYKVPAGLGIYFITSSLWQIGERLMLPKSKPLVVGVPEPEVKRAATTKVSASPSSAKPGPGGARGGWMDGLRDKVRQITDAADKSRTALKTEDAREDDRPRSRPRPGGRRR